jgi:hypothetical protein
MKNLFHAGKLLLLDMASTLFFLVVYLTTRNVTLAVVLGMALGAAQIGWQFARKQPIDTMQWMSLFLVLGAGAATLITNDPRFVMIKPMQSSPAEHDCVMSRRLLRRQRKSVLRKIWSRLN